MATCLEVNTGSSYALLWQDGRVANDAIHGGLRFDNTFSSPEGDYRNHGDVLTVARQGTYLIEWYLFVPAGVELETRVSLQVSGAPLPGGSLTIAHRRTDSGSLYSARSVISLLAGAPLRLSSSSLISYSVERPDALASLLVERL